MGRNTGLGGIFFLLGLDTHADCNLIRKSLVPKGASVRRASVAVRGVGRAKAEGWVQLEVVIGRKNAAAAGGVTKVLLTFLVLEDDLLPRDALVGFTSLVQDLQLDFSSARQNEVKLLGKTFEIVAHGSAGEGDAAVASGAVEVQQPVAEGQEEEDEKNEESAVITAMPLTVERMVRVAALQTMPVGRAAGTQCSGAGRQRSC